MHTTKIQQHNTTLATLHIIHAHNNNTTTQYNIDNIAYNACIQQQYINTIRTPHIIHAYNNNNTIQHWQHHI